MASGSLVYSNESDPSSTGTTATVSGMTVFEQVTGAQTGLTTVTVTATPVTGQVLYIYNNTTGGFDLTLGGTTVIHPTHTDMFIWVGGVWVEMIP